MASRMDRYSKTESKVSGRSDRNKSLYKQIEDLDSYTNIAGVATIDSKNSINLDKVKELLRNVESKQERIIEKKEVEQVEETEEEVRNYDIKDMLSKVKDNGLEEEKKYRSLSSKQYEVLKELNEKTKKTKSEEVSSLEDLVKTISDMTAISEEDDVGLLDDLKSDTMVGDASSIKKIIDDEKELTSEFENMSVDKSFYTSSFGFTQKDFEELKDINHKIKKDNKKIITLLIILILVIIASVVFVFIK